MENVDSFFVPSHIKGSELSGAVNPNFKRSRTYIWHRFGECGKVFEVRRGLRFRECFREAGRNLQGVDAVDLGQDPSSFGASSMAGLLSIQPKQRAFSAASAHG